ncbi:hypothetical protein C9374_009148 [Naegleria lovaniensis]|uniref:Carboxypeptidase n=1 Tax=Naegleria lovaniensis TaxID=51637 RepID=A0AA88GDX3_NAELO|nr:uncharacterized protein C9374_009148 [Naegleria lovaniensis]KAG2377632.1 hypothetical protein C9374_009148 [Naegleria lovaniensis]
MKFTLVLLVGILFFCCCSTLLVDHTHATTAVTTSSPPQRITSLPGFNGPISFAQYSGYVPVSTNSTEKRFLFYWFVESQSASSSEDPVVLWMNGGPGCSSLDGFVTEHGPFLLNDDGKTLRSNDHAWNKRANIIYLESPFEVGYSFTTNKNDHVWNDVKSANDVLQFLAIFFSELFPQYLKNPFYIAAESYGGHYGPTTAVAVLRANQHNQFPFKFNLKGFIVANGIMDDREDTNSVPIFMYQHSLISKSSYEDGLSKCKGDFYKFQNLPECSNVISQYYTSIVGVNPYDIYANCVGDVGPFASNNEKEENASFLETMKSNGWMKALTQKQGSSSSIHPLFTLSARVGSGAPCLAYKPQEYWFNLNEVKMALHASPLIPQDHRWQMCNNVVNSFYNRTYDSMIPFYQELLSNGIRGLFYSGDCDLAVNSLGSQNGIYALMNVMNGQIVKPYQSWMMEKQVAGFYQIWSAGSTTMTFKTIKGAGHMVPMTRPKQAQTVLYDFIFN